MVSVDQAVVARLRKEGKTFEILVDCDKALELREGKPVGIDNIVATNAIFYDVKKGERAPGSELLKLFKTEDARKISEVIIREGEVQLTSKHCDKLREEKKRQIITIIHRNAIDSKTGLPHPPQRIEAAMEEAKVHLDEHKPAEQQVEDVLKKIRLIIPIKFEMREIAVRVPVQYAAVSFPMLKRYKLLKEEWQNDGSLIAVVEIPAGIQNEFFSDVNKASHGEAETKIIRSF